MAIDDGVDVGTVIDDLRGRRSDDDHYIHDVDALILLPRGRDGDARGRTMATMDTAKTKTKTKTTTKIAGGGGVVVGGGGVALLATQTTTTRINSSSSIGDHMRRLWEGGRRCLLGHERRERRGRRRRRRRRLAKEVEDATQGDFEEDDRGRIVDWRVGWKGMHFLPPSFSSSSSSLSSSSLSLYPEVDETMIDTPFGLTASSRETTTTTTMTTRRTTTAVRDGGGETFATIDSECEYPRHDPLTLPRDAVLSSTTEVQFVPSSSPSPPTTGAMLRPLLLASLLPLLLLPLASFRRRVMTYRNRVRLMHALMRCHDGRRQFVIGREELNARIRGLRKTKTMISTAKTTTRATKTKMTTTIGIESTVVGERYMRIGDESAGALEYTASTSSRERRRRGNGAIEGKYSMNGSDSHDRRYHKRHDDAHDENDEYSQHASYLRWVEDNESLERERKRVENLYADLVCSQERCDMLSERLAEITGERDRLLSSAIVAPSPAESADARDCSERRPRAESSCHAERSTKQRDEDPNVETLKREGFEAKDNEMQLRQHVLHLSSIAHLTEENDLLKRRIALLEAERDEMGNEMDYLMDEIILLRRKKKDRVDIGKDVNTSRSIGTLMIESLSDDGDCDYDSCDDDNDDDDDDDSEDEDDGERENNEQDESPTTEQVMDLLVERSLRLAFTPCQEEDDAQSTCQPASVEDEGGRSIDVSDITNNALNTTKQDMDFLVERSLRLAPTPCQVEVDAQSVNVEDEAGRSIDVSDIIDNGSFSLSALNNLEAPMISAGATYASHKKYDFDVHFRAMEVTRDIQPRQVAPSTDLNADETCNDNLLIGAKVKANPESDLSEICLTSEHGQIALSGAELMEGRIQIDLKVAPHSSCLELHEEHAVAIPLAKEGDAIISRIGYDPLPKIGDGFTLMAAETMALLSDRTNEPEQQHCINNDVGNSSVATAFDILPGTINHNRSESKKEEESLAGNELMVTSQSPTLDESLIFGFHINIHDSSSSFPHREVSTWGAVSVEEAQTSDNQSDVLKSHDKRGGFFDDIDAKKSSNIHCISVGRGEAFENLSFRTVRADQKDSLSENETDGVDHKVGHHSDCGIINSPSHNCDDLIVHFRDREAAHGEQGSDYSASSNSYENFLSFTMTPAKRSEDETPSEVMSMISNSSSQSKRDNAVKMLSKLWKRSPRGAVDGIIGRRGKGK